MVAVAHQRADIAPVDAHRQIVAVPADGIERIIGEGDGRETVMPLDHDFPWLLALLRFEGFVDGGHIEHGRVENAPARRPGLYRAAGSRRWSLRSAGKLAGCAHSTRQCVPRGRTI